MQLTFNAGTALWMLRTLRSGRRSQTLGRRTDLVPPAPGSAGRWSHKAIAPELEARSLAIPFDEQHPLEILVARKEDRLRMKDVRNTLCGQDLPAGSFIDLGDGLAMSGPELLFVEMGRVMDPVVHVLLGMELCGRFSRDADSPRNGDATYDVEPVTTVDRLRDFAREAHGLRGATRALASLDHVLDDAWSPVEALLATLIMLPSRQLGYDLWPITLNERKDESEQMRALTDRDARIPDIMFRGTSVGLNYDGADHFGLERIATSARAAERDPGNAQLEREAAEAIEEARARIVDDKRRDRELQSMGYTVLPVTYEDLVAEGGLDRVIALAIAAIMSEGKRKPQVASRMLGHPALAQARQELIWSLLPGKRASEARRRLEELRSKGHLEGADVIDYEIRYTVEDGDLRVLSVTTV